VVGRVRRGRGVAGSRPVAPRAAVLSTPPLPFDLGMLLSMHRIGAAFTLSLSGLPAA
jgi:hypothetical protein